MAIDCPTTANAQTPPSAEPQAQLDAQKQPEAPQRDAQGRFAKGNRGGPGNPFARRVAGYRKAFMDAVSEEDFQAVAAATLKAAKEGNQQAAKLVFTYLMGTPAPAPDPDRLDADEWQCYHETAKMIMEVPYIMSHPEPSLPLSVVRTARPGLTADIARKFAAFLIAGGEAKAATSKADNPKEGRAAAEPSANAKLNGRPNADPSANVLLNGPSTGGPSANAMLNGRPNADPSSNALLNGPSTYKPLANGAKRRRSTNARPVRPLLNGDESDPLPPFLEESKYLKSAAATLESIRQA